MHECTLPYGTGKKERGEMKQERQQQNLYACNNVK